MRKTLATLVLLAAALGVVPARADVPPTPPRDQWYAQNDTGHWSDGTRVRVDDACLGIADGAERAACSLAALKAKPFVVIAFVDTGINPYHADFRAPEFTHHPSEYIEGYPAGSQAIDLSFDVADAQGYAAARAEDDANLTWRLLFRNTLYWFPGTRIVGAISTAAGGSSSASRPERIILDDDAHGTGVASVAAGRYYGSNPNALIVAVEGLGQAGLSWAASQPWIDVVSNSWGPAGHISVGSAEDTRQSTRRGQSILHSAGNGFTNTNSSTAFPAGGPVEDPCKCKTPDQNQTILSQYTGPSWIVAVGAASPINGQAHWWNGTPVDIASFGSKWRAAHAFGVARAENRDFGGTSCATPVSAGVLSAIVERARVELGDTTAGQRPGAIVAQGAPVASSPFLSDGMLSRAEAETILKMTAFPVAFDQERYTWDYAVRPTTGYYYAYQGYGVVDAGSKQRALDVLMGTLPLPARPEVDEFQARVNVIADAIYGAP